MTNTIIGYNTTKFGELWDFSLEDLIKISIDELLQKANLQSSDLNAVFFGNMLGGISQNRLLLSSYISEILETNIPIQRVESACASGGSAFYLACEYLNSHKDETVLVVGAEKMTDCQNDITDYLSSALSYDEQLAGLTFPGIYAMMANYYFEKYGASQEDLANISVKNHDHAILNPDAHIKKKITIDQVMSSDYIAYPLKLLDSSLISDGASALILTNKKSLISQSKDKVSVLSCECATDSISLAKREEFETFKSTKYATEKAFYKADIKREDIDIIELHDCFTIAEILAMETMGFWEKGTGYKNASSQECHRDYSKKLITNPSGGLKACGHPVGATGVKQIGEIFLHLSGNAGKRQINHARYGLAHNVGGSGGIAIVTILKSLI